MIDAHSYESLLGTLQQMKEEILNQIKPLEEQIVYAGAEEQKKSFADNADKLAKCLAAIDGNIFKCHEHVKEYDGIRSALHEINERISQLGSERMPVANGLANLDLAEVIKERIEYLRSQKKI